MSYVVVGLVIIIAIAVVRFLLREGPPIAVKNEPSEALQQKLLPSSEPREIVGPPEPRPIVFQAPTLGPVPAGTGFIPPQAWFGFVSHRYALGPYNSKEIADRAARHPENIETKVDVDTEDDWHQSVQAIYRPDLSAPPIYVWEFTSGATTFFTVYGPGGWLKNLTRESDARLEAEGLSNNLLSSPKDIRNAWTK